MEDLSELDHEGPVFVVFTADIHPVSARALFAALGTCANNGVEEVHLLLGTPGGAVDVGLEVYNLLLGVPFKLVTHNLGNVASIGVPIYLAGEERLACSNSTFMLHGITNQVPNTQAFEVRWFKEKLDSMRGNEQRINSLIAERTKLTKKELNAYLETEEHKTAKEAVKDGIAHRVAEIDIPQDAAVLTVQF